MRIQIIDDDDDSTSLLESLLSPPHRVERCGCAEDAIAVASVFKPHLVISDWDLGNADGIEVYKTILQHCNVPVIFISGSPIDRLRAATSTLNPLKLLQKPLDLDEVLQLVHALEEKLHLADTR